MKNNRRDFLKFTGLVGAGILAGNVNPVRSNAQGLDTPPSRQTHLQKFNMSGYAAPKLNTVRLGFIGLGNRGPTHLQHATKLEGVEIKALCDLRPEKVTAAQKLCQTAGSKPNTYTGKEDEWKKLCEQKDIDLIYIATPWHLHVPMALYAMEQGKHVAVEVPVAKTLEECWQLVETSERTKRHCVILENCCYDFFELLTLNMARQGFFGEIIHGEGAYIHDLLEGNFSKTKYYDMWRLKENFRNGNLYPTHGLGPIAQIMNINRGDKMDYLVSMSGNDFMMGATAKELASKDEFYRPFATKTYRGNMNTTTIRTSQGRTIMLQHDVTSPRVYSRIHLVSGTKGAAQKYPLPGRISTGHEDWLPEAELKKLEEKFLPPIVKKVGEMAKQVGGHGGMDFLMNWRLMDCLRNGLPVDMDVYDTATWSAISPLSEQSVAKRSNSVDVPDFTAGAWKNNQPVDIQLAAGGTTKIKL
ncbi:Gfo/Idh/MocA family oxidoreductase [Adhaeribacter radiodurans]|uniref:Gfo/Idh/MocA family oxidoreductase n=1 Tax=Adhaeribacter radiodurans TaxID=2745197 RepID=A0A7L7LCY8_9BACT|nr:Gfo/Idh/MocA family oxidoreductase [Adhaeribacter radiodurans]QMU30554.1 Gfo/Idh/MocA family oxidoreductase [Adhaeribacter radiodurans]